MKLLEESLIDGLALCISYPSGTHFYLILLLRGCLCSVE